MKEKLSISIILSLLLNVLIAQLPETDMYVLGFELSNDSMLIKECKFINGFNKSGYNNQAFWVSQDQFLITSNLENPNTTELYSLDMSSYTFSRLTNNQLSEYSPQLRPDSESLTYVRVEENKDQVILEQNFGIDKYPSRIVSTTKDIAYFLWLNKEQMVICQLTGQKNTMNLLLNNVEQNKSLTLVEDVGRCIRKDNQNDDGFYFIHKLTSNFWYLKYYNLKTKKVSLIVQLLQGVEDFDLLDDGSIIIGKLNKLYRFRPQVDNDWGEMVDLSDYGLSNIKRIAIHSQKLICTNTK